MSSSESIDRLVAESRQGVIDAQKLVDDVDSRIQRRRQEAWECRIIGYWLLALAVVLFGIAMILGYAFGIPGTEAVIGWLVGPGILSVILGSLMVVVGAVEGY